MALDNIAFLPRDVLAGFLPDPRSIRAFEGAQQQILTNQEDIASQAATISDATFLTLASEPVLGHERIFTPDTGSFDVTDGGANGAYSIALKALTVTPATYGTAGKVATVTVDAKGRVTNVVETNITTTAIGAAPTARLVSAGTGLTGGGDLSADRTINVASAGTYGLPTGTLARAIFATYTAATISNPPTQTEVQAIANALQAVSRTLAALVTDMKANGNLS